MINRIMKRIIRRISGNYTEIPVAYVTFDYQKYKKGIEKNCMLHVHPLLHKDEKLKQMMFQIVDYIRANYSMHDFIEVNKW